MARLVFLLLLVVGAGAMPPAAHAAELIEGTHEGAEFLIGMPERWNGGLVLFAHGYDGEGPGRGSLRGSPMSGYLTTRGYAWAASSYRSRGYRPEWVLAHMTGPRPALPPPRGAAAPPPTSPSRGYRPDWFLADMMALRAHFIARFGAPRWTILH